MTAQPANITILDGSGVEFLQRVYDLSGTGAGPWLPITLVVGPDGQTLVDFGALLNGIITKLSAVGLASGSKVGVQVGGADVAASNPVPFKATGPDYQPSGVTPVTSSFSAAGQTSAFTPKYGREGIVLELSGTAVASLQVEVCVDGTNFRPIMALDGATQMYLIAYSGTPCVIFLRDLSLGQYRVNVLSVSSGTMTTKLFQ